VPITFPIKFRLKGVDEFRKACEEAPKWLVGPIDRVVETGMEVIVSDAKQIVPVRTGRLRDSIRYWRKHMFDYDVGSEVPYAGFVEFGTTRMRAQPYMRPAIQQNAPGILKAMKEEVHRQWVRYLKRRL